MYTLRDIFLYNPDKPLQFDQYLFWLFFSVLFAGYLFVYRRDRLRILYLMCFSLFFYYKSGGYFFFLLLFSTVVDYTIGNWIYRSQTKWKKISFVVLNVTINLGILIFFKYSYFIVDNINLIFHTHFQAYNYLAGLFNAIGNPLSLNYHLDTAKILLPAGISFFTFQTISYSVDIYREKIKPAKNILDYGFFVTFFPQLVSGPIVRAIEFVPQIHRKYSLTKEEFSGAIFLIINGLMKKVLISDYISGFVDRIFASPGSFSGFENLMAVYGYSIQIYCDFSGYTDIAIGVALLLGFHLPLNFNSPYKSNSTTDFWRRWHISLSRWLRDYLYIPLGGNRKGKIRQYINLMITMLLGGLWHGASVVFIIWGGLHGIGLAVHKLWADMWKRVRGIENDSEANQTPVFRFFDKIWNIISVIITFHFVAFCWIFFRSRTLDDAKEVLNRIFNNFQSKMVGQMIQGYGNIFAVIIIGYAIHFLPLSFKNAYKNAFNRTPLVVKAVIVAGVVIFLYQFATAGRRFIYFQF